MAVVLSEATIAAEPLGAGMTRKRLLTHDSVKGARFILERLTLAAGVSLPLTARDDGLVWVQMLDGAATLNTGSVTDSMTDGFSVMMTSSFKDATLTADTAVTLLRAEFTDIGRLDPGYPATLPHFEALDWNHEQVLESKPDGRKRVLLVSPDICDTAAFKADMVIYPPGSAGPECHHVGADCFMYLAAGRGMARANGQTHVVRAGDLIHFPDGEPHAMQSGGADNLRFVEFYVPGTFKTVWTNPSKASAWTMTHRDIQNRIPVLDQNERWAYRYVFKSRV